MWSRNCQESCLVNWVWSMVHQCGFSPNNGSSIPTTLRASCSAHQRLRIKQRAPPAPDERHELIVVQHNLCQNSVLELDSCSSRGQKGGRGKQSNTSHTEATIADGEASLDPYARSFSSQLTILVRPERSSESNSARDGWSTHGAALRTFIMVGCPTAAQRRIKASWASSRQSLDIPLANSLHLSCRMSSIALPINIGAPNNEASNVLRVMNSRENILICALMFLDYLALGAVEHQAQ